MFAPVQAVELAAPYTFDGLGAVLLLKAHHARLTIVKSE